MPKQPASTGTSPAKPATPDEQIAKALKDIEEMTKALEARARDLDKREEQVKLRESTPNLGTTPDPKVTAQIAKSHQSKAEKMRDHLHAQPKVMIMIPLEPGEKEGSTKSVTLNGYRYTIMKNVYVEVPRQIAEVIATSLRQTLSAGQAFRVDAVRPAKDGTTVAEALA